MRIAILGWGSLLWEGGDSFDRQHESWEYDGPVIKIEFSRISNSRSGALTLVIDPENGTLTTVAYCLSVRTDYEDTASDLQTREGTTRRNIGFAFANENRFRCRDSESGTAILTWAVNNGIDVAIWTDLESNFQRYKQQPFTSISAISHLRELDSEGKSKAIEYIRRAPPFVSTTLRIALKNENWFTKDNDKE